MIAWNFDMAAAPRGMIVEGARVQMGENSRANRNFVPQRILIAFFDKGVRKVSQTYRVEPSKTSPDGWWAGLATTNEGYAWAPFPEPPEPRA